MKDGKHFIKGEPLSLVEATRLLYKIENSPHIKIPFNVIQFLYDLLSKVLYNK